MFFGLRMGIIVVLVLAFPMLSVSDTNMPELEAKIKAKEVALNAELFDLRKNGKAIEKAILNFEEQKKYIGSLKHDLFLLKQQIRKLKEPTQKIKESNLDDVPNTVVFNRNREWNPEKIIWKDKFWECTNYNDDGICLKVEEVEGAVVE